MDFNFDINTRFVNDYSSSNLVCIYKDNLKCEIRYNGGEYAVYYDKFSEDAQNAIYNESFSSLRQAMEHIICNVPRTKKRWGV